MQYGYKHLEIYIDTHVLVELVVLDAGLDALFGKTSYHVVEVNSIRLDFECTFDVDRLSDTDPKILFDYGASP